MPNEFICIKSQNVKINFLISEVSVVGVECKLGLQRRGCLRYTLEIVRKGSVL